MRQEKQLHLDAIKEQIDQYGSFLIMSYLGLTANAAHKLRREVAKCGGAVEVLPKRMLTIAAKEAGVELNTDDLPGHIGVVFAGEDPVETTKVVFEFRKSYQDNIQFVGGHIDGSVLDGGQVEKLSQLPGKQQMRADFLAVLQAPLVQTVSTMNALLTSVLFALDNKSKKSEG